MLNQLDYLHSFQSNLARTKGFWTAGPFKRTSLKAIELCSMWLVPAPCSSLQCSHLFYPLIWPCPLAAITQEGYHEGCLRQTTTMGCVLMASSLVSVWLTVSLATISSNEFQHRLRTLMMILKQRIFVVLFPVPIPWSWRTGNQKF